MRLYSFHLRNELLCCKIINGMKILVSTLFFIIITVSLFLLYPHVKEFSACEEHTEKWGYIDESGKMVIGAHFCYAGDFDEEGVAYVKWGKCSSSCVSAGECHHGLIDRHGHIIAEVNTVEFEGYYVEHIGAFIEGIALTSLTRHDGSWGKHGYINKKGDWIINPEYDDLDIFRDGRAMFRLCEGNTMICKTGFLDRAGNVVIEPEYYNLSFFSENLAAVNTNRRCLEYAECEYHYIDTEGDIVIPGPFQEAWAFMEGLALVHSCNPLSCSNGSAETCRYALINKSGSCTLLPKRIGSIYPPQVFNGSLIATFNGRARSDTYQGLIDVHGNIVIGPEFCEIRRFHNGLAPASIGADCSVQSTLKWGFINMMGAFVIEPAFDMVSGFSDNLALVNSSGKHLFIDTKGQIIAGGRFHNADNFKGGLAAVYILKDRRVKHYIDVNTGDYLNPDDFSTKCTSRNNCFPVYISYESLLGFIDTSGTLLIEPSEYIDTRGFSNGLAAVRIH